MQGQDFRKYYVLYVDDEEKSLKNFDRAFGMQFKILTAANATDALGLLERHLDEIAVLITDQQMPGHKGVWLLDKARQMKPGILRILATAYSNLDAVIEAVNTGAIYHYLTKPWDPPQLENTLKHALQLFTAQRERDQLLREKMSVLHNQMVSDRIVSLGYMAAGMSHHIRNSLVPVKTFIDLVRASGGNNRGRYLLIAGYATDIGHTVDSAFKMPQDPVAHSMVSVHFTAHLRSPSWRRTQTGARRRILGEHRQKWRLSSVTFSV